MYKNNFTPLHIENSQSASSSSLLTAPIGGVLNERMCKNIYLTGGAYGMIYQ